MIVSGWLRPLRGGGSCRLELGRALGLGLPLQLSVEVVEGDMLQPFDVTAGFAESFSHDPKPAGSFPIPEV
jgi:hypothetical protein